jgi:hypothetical protein
MTTDPGRPKLTDPDPAPKQCCIQFSSFQFHRTRDLEHIHVLWKNRRIFLSCTVRSDETFARSAVKVQTHRNAFTHDCRNAYVFARSLKSSVVDPDPYPYVLGSLDLDPDPVRSTNTNPDPSIITLKK